MRYLIDGHNLIPKLGLRLQDPQDEELLVARLQEFCRLRRAQVEVYFDGAPPGFPTLRRMGAVTVHFVRQGSSADTALEARLMALGKQARNWTVVSSDRRIQAAAHAAHANVLSAEAFVREMFAAPRQPAAEWPEKQERALSPEEVDEWLQLFRSRKK